jgi:acetyl esterase/lipase
VQLPIGMIVVTLWALLAVVPIRRPRPLATATGIAATFPGELPFLFLVVVVGPNLVDVLDGDLSAADRITVALCIVVVCALGVVVARSLQTRAIVARGLDEGIGPRRAAAAQSSEARRRLRRWLRVLFVPWPLRPRDIACVTDVSYGDRGDEQRCDVYRSRSAPPGGPTFVHLHGGHFRWGRKSREARVLLFRLARRGWTCVSANYHLSHTPIDGFPTHLVDVKQLLVWARAEGARYGIGSDAIVLSGSSAGAHLAAMATLTANDPAFQPGFEHADTSITAGVGLGGYYGGLDGRDDSPTSPLAHRAAAPPFFVVHGDHDTVVAPDVARRFVAHLRGLPRAVVVHAELPGGRHAFDLFDTIRFEAVVDGVVSFAESVTGPRA